MDQNEPSADVTLKAIYIYIYIYISSKAGDSIVACVQIKKSENQTFVKHKGGSHDFREKPRFRLYKNQIAVNS